MTIITSVSIVLIMTAAGTLISFIIMAKNGWIITTKNIRFFGFNFDAYNFDQLSAIIEYFNISKALRARHNLEVGNIDEFTLIYIGWGLIADAYIERFREYPDVLSLKKNAAELGGQNVEFIRVFQRVYQAGSKILFASKIRQDFAFEYFNKSTGLTERIMSGSGIHHKVYIAVEKKLRAAGYNGNFELVASN